MPDAGYPMVLLEGLFGEVGVLWLFYVMSFVFLFVVVRGLWRRRGPSAAWLGAGTLLLLVPSWAAVLVAGIEMFGPRHSGYVAVVLVFWWAGIAVNLLNSIPVAVAWWRVLAAASRR